MAADYIPGADGAFDAWQTNFITYASANAAALGLDPLIDIPPCYPHGHSGLLCASSRHFAQSKMAELPNRLLAGEFLGDVMGVVDFHQGFHDSVDVH